jgi:hypothetical protein
LDGTDFNVCGAEGVGRLTFDPAPCPSSSRIRAVRAAVIIITIKIYHTVIIYASRLCL